MEETKCQINVHNSKGAKKQPPITTTNITTSVGDNNASSSRSNSSSNFMINVQASCLEHLLHGCWEVLYLIDHGQTNSNNNNMLDDDNCMWEINVNYTIKIKDVLTLEGNHHISTNTLQDDDKDEAFLSGGVVKNLHHHMTPNHKNSNKNNNSEDVAVEILSVYCIRITTQNNVKRSSSVVLIHPDDISILVDNERFIDPTIKAHVHVISRSKDLITTTSTTTPLSVIESGSSR